VKPFFVYMLRCRDGSYYVGHTDELEKRLIEHQHGVIPGHTSTRRPVELVWFAEMPTRDEALEREMQLKGWVRRKKEALIREDWSRMKQLARGPDRHARAPFDSAPAADRGGDSGRYAQGERKVAYDAAGRGAYLERSLASARRSRRAQGERKVAYDAAGRGACPERSLASTRRSRRAQGEHKPKDSGR
jgi:predicted GIY-YIG superfamily endonuclease